MDIKDLTVFKKVAEEGSISKAAKSLSYVQSNVTMKIKQLEDELGVPLFYRNGKGVTLNSNGEILLTYTRKILDLTEQSIRLVQSNQSKPLGTLKIGTTNSTVAVRLPPLLKNYCEKYPEVELVLETHKSTELTQLVLERKLEGAFIVEDVHHPDLTSFLFCQEELTIISYQPLHTLQELDKVNMLAFGNGCHYRNRVDKWLKEAGIYPKRVLEFGTIEAIIGCVKAGMGIAVMVKSILKDHEQSLTMTDLPEKYSKVPTYFIMRKDVLFSAALQRFVEMIKEKTM
ncbi:LysR family transcriptional regulator [Bacillus cereus]|uniref:LysR family transcriptional regulator n=1 Tax=Bacillus cereus TaxID=1396 RepID=UPI003D65BD63